MLDTAANVESEQDAVSLRVASLYEAAFSRPPSADELDGGRRFVAALADELGTTLEDVRVWSAYAHVLWNTKEFVFVR